MTPEQAISRFSSSNTKYWKLFIRDGKNVLMSMLDESLSPEHSLAFLNESVESLPVGNYSLKSISNPKDVGDRSALVISFSKGHETPPSKANGGFSSLSVEQMVAAAAAEGERKATEKYEAKLKEDKLEARLLAIEDRLKDLEEKPAKKGFAERITEITEASKLIEETLPVLKSNLGAFRKK